MSFADVDDAAIRYAMSTLPDTFKTKDLSEHPAVLATHTEVSQLRNYHTIIGRYLMQNRAALGLDEPGKPVDERGSVWTKTTKARRTRLRLPPSCRAIVLAAPRCVLLRPTVAAASQSHQAPAPAEEGPQGADHDPLVRPDHGTCLVGRTAVGGQPSPVRQGVPQAHAHARGGPRSRSPGRVRARRFGT